MSVPAGVVTRTSPERSLAIDLVLVLRELGVVDVERVDVDAVELRRVRRRRGRRDPRVPPFQWKWICRPLPSSSHLARPARCSGGGRRVAPAGSQM